MFRNNFGFRATMVVLPVAMLCVLNLAWQAEAQEFGFLSQQPTMTSTSSVSRYVPAVTGPVTYASPNVVNRQLTSGSISPTSSQFKSTSNTRPGLAQSKAARAAQIGLRGHLGGGLGGAKYEGVGWSNQSPRQAIEHCCYWGTRPTAQIGVSEGRDGCWYACVLYH